MKKTGFISMLLVLLLGVCLLAGCGGEGTGNDSAGRTEETDSRTDIEKDETDGEENSEEGSGQPQPVELENFTSGTLYEEGEYLFSIDSMEMTEDAYVITYRASTDARNYSGYYDMQLIINGVAFHYNDFTFTDENRESNSMIGGGPDRAIRVTLPRTLLAHAGIREVTSVQFDVTLGYSAHSSVYEEVEIRATVYPGAKPAEVDPFPTPKQDSWVLLDNEEGKVQIVDANYWVSAADGHIMGVTFHILTQGKGNGYIALRNLNVGDWTSGKQMGDVNCLLSPGVRYCRITLMGGGDPAEDADYSQSILSYYAYYNEGGTVEELSATLDLSGLANQ